MSTTHIQVAGLVGAQPEVVWEVLADHRSWPEWYAYPDGRSGLSRVEVLQAVPGGVGTRRRCSFAVAGRERAVWEELIVEWEPGRALGYVGVGDIPGAHWWRGRLTLTPNGPTRRSTLVEWQASYEPSNWYAAVLDALLLRRVLAACMEHGLEQLDVRLSGRGATAAPGASTEGSAAEAAAAGRTPVGATTAAEGSAS